MNFFEDLDFDTYIEYISHDYFYAGNIEIILTAQIYQIKMQIYIIENNKNYYYKKIAGIGAEFITNKIYVLITNDDHYSLLVTSGNNNNSELEKN